jgi:transposase-like protein
MSSSYQRWLDTHDTLGYAYVLAETHTRYTVECPYCDHTHTHGKGVGLGYRSSDCGNGDYLLMMLPTVEGPARGTKAKRLTQKNRRMK